MEGRATQVKDNEDLGSGWQAGGQSGPAAVSAFASAIVSLLAERSALKANVASNDPSPEITDAFVAAALSGSDRAFDALLGQFRKTRVRYEMVADVYIPEAARQMGDAWLNDELSWLDVSIGAARLQSLLREISAAWTADIEDHLGQGAVLLLVPDGEQHTLGTMVAMGQLRRMGVSVCLRFAPSHLELSDLLQEKMFDGILVSLSTEARIQSAAILVRFLRTMRKNLPPIIIGGPIVAEKPELMSCIGADHSCNDIRAAMNALGINIKPREIGSLERA